MLTYPGAEVLEQAVAAEQTETRPDMTEIVADFDPDGHPVVGPLRDGGPAELVRRYELAREDGYADHCHLSYESRRVLRSKFPDELTPDQMYGVA